MTHLADAGKSMSDSALQILGRAGAGIVVTGADGGLRFANAQFWSLAGRPEPADMPDVGELVHPDDVPKLERAFETAASEHSAGPLEARILRGDGSSAWARWTSTSFEDEDLDGTLVLSLVTSVSEDGGAQSADGRRYRALAEATGTVVWKTTTSGDLIEANDEWTALTGQDGEAQANNGWLEAIHPEDRDMAAAIWARALADGAPASWEYRVRRADGGYRRMLVRAVPVHDDAGQVVEFVGTLSDVPGADPAAEDAHTSAAMMEALMASSPVGVAFFDREARYLRVNPALAAMTGVPVADHIGKTVAELQPALWATEEPYFRQVLESGKAVDEHLVEGRPSPGGNRPRYWLTSYFPVPGPGREPAGVAVAVIEVTRRVQAEKALEESDARQRALMEATPAMVIVSDAKGRAVFTNRAWEEFTGLVAAEGPRWAEQGYIHPNDLQRASDAWEQARKKGEGYDIDYRVRNKKGDYCWVAFQIRPVQDESGVVVSWTAAAIDIDERVRTQEAYQASEARLRALVDATPAMVVITDPEGAVQLVSREWMEFTGLDADAMTHWRELDTVHPEDAAATAEERRRGLLSQAGYEVDYRVRRFDGEYRWVSASVRPALASDGRLLGWMFVGVDVDDRVRARQRLEAMNADLRQLAESIPAIVITSPEDPAEAPFANTMWTEYTGVPLEDVTQEVMQRLIHKADAVSVLRAWEKANAARQPYEMEFRLRRHDGNYRWFAWRTQPLIDGAGVHMGWITAGVDIDEQVRLRDQLQVTNEHLQLLADAGQAIAGAVDYEAAVDAAASVLVPSFAAWCVVDIVISEGTLVRKAAVHSTVVDDAAALALRDSVPSLDDPTDHLTGVIRSGEGLFIPHLPADLSALRGSGEHLVGLADLKPNSWIAVPLRAVGGRTLGVLSLARVGDQPRFTDQDYATVSELGRRLAASLDRSRLFSQVTRALANLRMLADAGLALSESREIEEALQKATSIIVPSYADWCTVDLVDGDVIRRAALVHSEQIDAEMAESMRGVVAQRADVNDPVARVIESGEPLFLPAIPDDMSHLGSRSEEYRSAARALRGGSSIGVPLQAGERTFGVLGMMRVQGREAFDETDLALSRELGRQLGGWVERGRLFSDLRQALSAKDEFFGFVSHELKTPLTTVVGVSDVLSRRYTELEEDQRQDAISLIRRDSLRLEEIIANMLTLARSERQTGDEPALVQHVLGGALSMHRQRHPHREVETRVEAGLPPVLAPAGWIDRVVENLLSNAEKYSDNPTKIEVEAEQVGKLVEVRVLDRGRGISEEQMRDVFEPFFRADPNEPGVSGVGLGLTVCRRLIERLGGEVWLAQREGGGTVAGFRLPVMDIPEE